MHFLVDIPPEVRLIIYDWYLVAHQSLRANNRVQPNNSHFRLLQVCQRIRDEASPCLHRYVSLLHEYQIAAFIRVAKHAQEITQVDVANDGRVMTSRDERHRTVSPVSRLFLALRMMPNLRRLRVFDCRQGLPAPGGPRFHGLVRLRSEEALFPDEQSKIRLPIYELHVQSGTRSLLFSRIQPEVVRTLRLSGGCALPDSSFTPALRHLTLDTVTGNFFDRKSLHETFVAADLEYFSYRLGDRLAFEIRDSHLHSLSLIGRSLRKLVLLGCSRFTSLALQELLVDLRQLEHLTLDLITVKDSELQHDFITPVSPSLSCFKLCITNARLTIVHAEEEASLADAFESLLARERHPKAAYLYLRDAVLNEGERRSRLQTLAERQGIEMVLGDWRNENEVYDHEIM
ncbi:hypothetical protein PENSPDRAFT_746624 [Peniophora sp. CONT]|nr:hypothetical protein PENSPDRAFT_746624 [Peniophora sp. CONT]